MEIAVLDDGQVRQSAEIVAGGPETAFGFAAEGLMVDFEQDLGGLLGGAAYFRVWGHVLKALRYLAYGHLIISIDLICQSICILNQPKALGEPIRNSIVTRHHDLASMTLVSRSKTHSLPFCPEILANWKKQLTWE